MKSTHFMNKLPRTRSKLPAAIGLWLGIFALSSTARASEQPAAQAPPPTPKWDMVFFEVKNWGEQVYSWQFTPLYGGVHMETLQPEQGQPEVRTVGYRTLETDAERYAQLERILDRLPDPAPDSNACENFVPDFAYGIIRLSRSATTTEISWNSGCMDRDYAGFLSTLREADSLVSGWARDLPISRTEKVRQ